MSAVAPERPVPWWGRRPAWWPEWGNTVQFAIAFVVINLHLLRNVSLVGYLAGYGVVSLWLAIAYLRTGKRGLLADRGYGFWIWVGMALWGLAVSLVTISRTGALMGLSRWGFAIPLFCAFVIFTDSRRDLVRHVATMCIVYTLAALTQPMQFLTGPVSWFPEPGSRGDVARYSSLLGSITTIGIVIGMYLVLTLALTPALRWPLFVLMLIPALTVVSKSAQLNVIMALVVVVIYYRRNRKALAIGAGALVLGLGAVLAIPRTRQFLVVTVHSLLGMAASPTGNGDAGTLWDNLVGRLLEIPFRQYITIGHASSPLAWIVGAGYGMGDTGLVPAPDALSVMAHNEWIEVLAIFGALGAVIMWGLAVVIAITLWRQFRRTGDVIYGIALAALVLFGINSLTASGLLFQPAPAAIFFFAGYVAVSLPLRRDAMAVLEVRRKEPVHGAA